MVSSLDKAKCEVSAKTTCPSELPGTQPKKEKKERLQGVKVDGGPVLRSPFDESRRLSFKDELVVVVSRFCKHHPAEGESEPEIENSLHCLSAF
jgi:hypothetical protein